MITLTTPKAIVVVLGGSTAVQYNKLVIAPFTMDGIRQTITGACVITATASPGATPLTGTVTIDIPGGNKLVLKVPDMDITNTLTLTSPQATAVIAAIETAQAALENGLITIGAVAGVRSAGV